jgi:hypothetical protein
VVNPTSFVSLIIGLKITGLGPQKFWADFLFFFFFTSHVVVCVLHSLILRIAAATFLFENGG